MPIVFVISDHWMLRTGVRAELRERGIDAMGIESAREALGRIEGGAQPAALVIDAGPGSASSHRTTVGCDDEGGEDAAIGRLIDGGVPAILISSRTITSPPWKPAVLLPRPVRVAEITMAVLRVLKGSAV